MRELYHSLSFNFSQVPSLDTHDASLPLLRALPYTTCSHCSQEWVLAMFGRLLRLGPESGLSLGFCVIGLFFFSFFGP